jgi:hypothetical protein
MGSNIHHSKMPPKQDKTKDIYKSLSRMREPSNIRHLLSMLDVERGAIRGIANMREPTNFMRLMSMLEFEDERAARELSESLAGRHRAILSARERIEKESEDVRRPEGVRRAMKRELLSGRVSKTEVAKAAHKAKVSSERYKEEKKKWKSKMKDVISTPWHYDKPPGGPGGPKGPPPPPPSAPGMVWA